MFTTAPVQKEKKSIIQFFFIYLKDIAIQFTFTESWRIRYPEWFN